MFKALCNNFDYFFFYYVTKRDARMGSDIIRILMCYHFLLLVTKNFA